MFKIRDGVGLREIPSQSGYFAGEDGSVWSMKSGTFKRMACFIRDESGHLGVNLTHNGVYRLHSIHRLVASTWIGSPPPGTVVMHLDDDPTNNCVGNLSYGTPAENSAQMVSRRRSARGESHPNSKLNEDQVRKIREMVGCGEKQKDVAAQFGITTSNVCDIIKNRIWRDVVS